MNTCAKGSSALLIYLALLSYPPETSSYLVDAPPLTDKNPVKDYPEDSSKFIGTTQEEVQQFWRHLKENRTEDSLDYHIERGSSEEDEKEEGQDDSAISEEVYAILYVFDLLRDLLTNPVEKLRPILDEEGENNWNLSLSRHTSMADSQERQNNAVSIIYDSFVNRKTFSCPRIKKDFVTGTDTGDLSPEDVGIIAAMGDSLATGAGLWPQTDIEFRGAAFPIGGDATIDGLVTIANILHEFNDKLVGVSHGMGTKLQLPYHQLNVAEGGASSSSMPSQAKELVKRLKALREVNIHNEWTMVIITIGTEEICKDCQAPNYDALLESLLILDQGIQNAFVILLGPIHVSSSYHREANLLKSRCNCSKQKSDEFMKELSREWTKAFTRLQGYFEQPFIKRRKFGVLALPMLTVTSRYPHSLFIPNRPLLNRKGHTYATKWLWNRLMTGPTYNLSLAVLSQDSYYCPSMGCPYFRTPANRQYCRLIRHVDVVKRNEEIMLGNDRPMRRSRQKLYATAGTVVVISFLTVLLIGTILYQKSKYEKRIRYGKSFLEDKEMELDSLTAKI
uniref:Lipase_GDSL domain-containing protein n=1 Tax=Setaria digitata TaxID=48799 RepID=A0A915PP32_9BILA